MSQDTLVFTGKLQNDIEFEVHSKSSFSGRSEIALFIKEQKEPFTIWSIDRKKSGTIECRPEMNKKVLILNKNKESESEAITPAKEPSL